ncbi:MAG: hypothetical protein PHH71_01575 [Clostridia bacterium]|jgi:hypothetical protein|nr:hypothetical protein [Clostridia bacterium]MDD3232100.1 hypothetical protein [Clostridia bacterium]MDD3862866.1 hypothetical protein [Clostridia bacterium]MDD4408402.1 hypothetical protein [Clostridia bacterium]
MGKILDKLFEKIKGERGPRNVLSEIPIYSTSFKEEPIDLSLDSEEGLIGYYPNPYFKENVKRIQDLDESAVKNAINDVGTLLHCANDSCTRPHYANPPSRHDGHFYSRLPKDELDEAKIALMKAISTRLQQYHQNREVLEDNPQYMRMVELMDSLVLFFLGEGQKIGPFLMRTAPKLGYRVNVEWPLANIIVGNEINLKEYFESWNGLYTQLNNTFKREIKEFELEEKGKSR